MKPSPSNNLSISNLFSQHAEFLQTLFPDLPPEFRNMDFRSQLDWLQSHQVTDTQREQIRAESELLFHVLGTTKAGLCRYAKDTGVLAFPNAPCRGNRIECRKVPDFISYAKRCVASKCKHFEAVRN